MVKRKSQNFFGSRESELEEGEISDFDFLSDLSEEEFNDGYDSDLMGDENDRKKLAQMIENEREQEIFKRIEVREAMKTRFNIGKKLRHSKKRELKKQKILLDNKCKQPILDLEGRVVKYKKIAGDNRSEVNKKFHAMNLLKSCPKEKKKQKMKQGKVKENDKRNGEINIIPGKMIELRGQKTKLKASDVYSDESESSSDENSTVKSKHSVQSSVSFSCFSSSSFESDMRVRNNRIRSIVTLEQLSKMKLSRHILEKLVHLPFFKQLAIGCFVRIMTGENNSDLAYRVCEIIDVCEIGKMYQLGNTRTNKELRLRHGLQECVFRLEFASNQEFSENEFNKWRETCALQGISAPTIEEMETKIRDIKEAMSCESKGVDIEKMSVEKDRFNTTPHNCVMKKKKLMEERDMAQEIGNFVRANELQNELNELEERAATLEKLRSATISKISFINHRNRKRNEEAKKAILTELKATKVERADDPFTRRRTKPSMLIKSKRAIEKEEISKYTAQLNLPNAIKNDKENDVQIKKANSRKQGEDIYAAHDFDIRIDFEVPLSTPTVRKLIVSKPINEDLPKRALNLEEYKRRKGFI